MDDAPLLVSWGRTPFDSAVARLISVHPRLNRPVADSAHAMTIGTRGMSRYFESAVVVEFTRCETGREHELLNWWAAMLGLVFAREGDGWRFVRYQHIGSADGHCGEPVEGDGISADDEPSAGEEPPAEGVPPG